MITFFLFVFTGMKYDLDSWEAMKTEKNNKCSSSRTSSTAQDFHTQVESGTKLYRNDPEKASPDQSVQPACDGRPTDHPHLKHLTQTSPFTSWRLMHPLTFHSSQSQPSFWITFGGESLTPASVKLMKWLSTKAKASLYLVR